MDLELLIRLAGTAVSLAAGAHVKHRTKVDHRIAGPAANVTIGLGAVGLGKMLGIDIDPAIVGDSGAIGAATEIAATTEFVYQGGKSLVRGVRGIGGFLRRLLP